MKKKIELSTARAQKKVRDFAKNYGTPRERDHAWWFIVIRFVEDNGNTRDVKTFRVVAHNAADAMQKVRAYIKDAQDNNSAFVWYAAYAKKPRALQYTHVAIIEGGRFDCGDPYIAIEEIELNK